MCEENKSASAVGTYGEFLKDEATYMDIKAIMDVLPHRQPFLLVDAVLWRDGIQAARGIKNLTENEFFFDNHFGENPELPKPILMEIMAQMGAACILNTPENKGKLILFASIDDCSFGKAPEPGDILDIRVSLRSLRRGMGKMLAECFVDGECRASGVLMFALADKT